MGPEAKSVRPNDSLRVDAIASSPHVTRAAELWQQGRFAEAEAILNRITPAGPLGHLALQLQGLMALRAGSYTQAVEFFGQAIAINGEIAAYHRNLGTAYLQMSRLGEAAGCFRQALAIEPHSAQAHFGLGVALLRQRVFEGAAAELEEAAKARPGHVDTHLNLGIALTELKRPEEAIAHWQCAIGLDQRRADAHLGLGVALRSVGALDDALKRITRATELDPTLAEAQFQLALILQAVGRPEAAAKALEQTLTLRPDMIAARQQLDRILTARTEPAETEVAISPPANILGRAEGGAAADRLNRYLELFLNDASHPRMGFYPGLTARPWHDPSNFAIVHALEGAYGAICQEISALEPKEFQIEIEGMSRVGSWDVFLFYERGRKNEDNCSRCPTITRIIETHDTVRTLAGLMYASKTRPGTHIVPHQGPTNMRLRVHLGIKIPQGDCGLRVGPELRRWKEGKCLVFDDSFEHESWNYTKEPRVVMILDIWHPDLTDHEKRFLQGLHRYAFYQAGSLNRYWTANADARERARKEYD